MNVINNFREFCYYVKSDLYRYTSSIRFKSFIRAYFIPGFRYTFWMRVCQWSKSTRNILIFSIARYMLYHYSIKYGIMIPYQTSIGPGLYIGHFSGIVVNVSAVIGSNVNISQCVTIGQKNEGNHVGTPIIGNKVYIAAGAKIIGRCRIGDRTVIGANAVVLNDIANDSVAVGIPAKIISKDGSQNYVGSFYAQENNNQ